MKKLFLILLFSILIFHISNGQFRVLYDYPSGDNPRTSFIYASGRLYGMTYSGGSYGKGCIYSIDTNGKQYKDLLDFNITNGGLPTDYNSTMIYASGKLYGATPVGSGSGNIFSIDTDGSNFKSLFTFNMTDGYGPGALTYMSGKLYGTTTGGGSQSDGTICTIDTDGANFKTLFNFDRSNGFYPLGNLTCSAGVLYGTTYTGGAYDDGVIFSLDTNGNNYKDMFDFNDTDGYEANGNLALIGNILCGTTRAGGVYKDGCVFSIHTDGSGFKVLLNFNDTTNGAGPLSSLTVLGNTLYGLTGGPLYEYGTIYSIDTNGNYHELFCFCQGNDTENATLPAGTVVLLGNTFYGFTADGGHYGGGIIFSYINGTTGIPTLNANSGKINIYPNPSNGIFQLKIRNGELGINNAVEIYNTLGEKVYSNYQITESSNYQIDLSSQSNGVYLYRVITEDGNLIGQGKLVIEK